MDELSALKIPDLKKLCKLRGLPQTGVKADLVARLQTAMASEKQPTVDDSILDDALIDEDSMLEGNSGDEEEEDSSDIGDLAAFGELTSPVSKVAPKPLPGSPAKPAATVSPTMSPIKKVEAVKRALSPVKPLTETNNEGTAGSGDGASPPKKRIVINRDAVVAPIEVEKKTESSEDDEGSASGKKVIKIGSVPAPLTAEERAKLRAQKFGAEGAKSAATAATVAASAVKANSPIITEKMRKRAERFSNGAGDSSDVAAVGGEPRVVSLTTEDDVKLAKRKERFGLQDETDVEAKKETRAARFGAGGTSKSTAAATATSTDANEKKQLRAARFGSN